MKRGSLLPAVAVLATLAVPTTASAATSIDLGGDTLAVTGDAFRNDIEVRRVGDGYVVSDSAANLSIVAGSDCFFSDPPREARCRTSGEVEVEIDGRAAADELTMTGGTRRAILDGGDGTDRLVGGPGPDRLIGGPNGDSLFGSSGNDVLIGEAGPDGLVGGPGIDTVSYAERGPTGVTITLPVDSFDVRSDDGNLLDGPVPGARDAINADVENAVGGDGADSILGNNERNSLQGRGNADVISGRGGDDDLRGGLGPDVLNGNDGFDRAIYDDHTQPLALSLDDVANDGSASEDVIINAPASADNIRADVEGVVGGAGRDVITGNAGPNRLDGGEGNDRLDGGAGDDDLNGGDGDETFVAESGADDVSGGPGRDSMSYQARSIPVTVSLDDVADDGTTGAEHDNVRADIEAVSGTRADDVLVGSEGDDRLDGGDGDDRLEGRGGDDSLQGGPSTDVVIGGDGIDLATYDVPNQGPLVVTLDGLANDGHPGNPQRGFADEADNVQTEGVSGSAGNDVLVGNSGPNLLVGGPGVDTLLGDAGADTIDANDGVRDEVDCGAGLDTALLDLTDPDALRGGGAGLAAGAGCESQSVAPAGRLPNVAVAKLVRIGGDHARVKLRCPRASHVRCAGTLRLGRLDATVLGRGRFALRKGERATVTLRLRRASGRGAAQVLARERDADGRPKLTLARVRLARRP